MSRITVLFREPPEAPRWAGGTGLHYQPGSESASAPRPWPRPTLLSDPFLGQLVLASGGGMGWLSSTRQGLFTMADDLEQQ